MSWLLAYAIGALAWCSIALLAIQLAEFSQAEKRSYALRLLRDAPIWPVAIARFVRCLMEAAAEMLAKHRKGR